MAANLLAELHWLAALKPSTCGLAAWQTVTHAYLEIAVLHAVLRPSTAPPSPPSPSTTSATALQSAQTFRLLDLIHRTIPYPVVLVVTHTGSGAEQLSPTHKRLSLGTGSAMVLEQSITTKPIATKLIAACACNTGDTAQFVQYIAFNSPASAPTRQLSNLHVRYSNWLNAIEALAASDHTGQFTVSTSAIDAARRRSALQKHGELGPQLASLAPKPARKASLAQEPCSTSTSQT